MRCQRPAEAKIAQRVRAVIKIGTTMNLSARFKKKSLGRQGAAARNARPPDPRVLTGAWSYSTTARLFAITLRVLETDVPHRL